MTTPFPFVAGAVLTAAQLNDITNLPINDKTASYTLVAGDAGKRVVMNNAGATTITVNNSVFAVGDVVEIVNKGAGTTTVTAGAGVTINGSGTALSQYKAGQLLALSASTFIFIASGSAMQTQVTAFTASGTFTPPTGVTYAIAHIRAGGGGAGRSSVAGGTGGTSSVAFAGGTISATGGEAQAGQGVSTTTNSAVAGTANSGLGGGVIGIISIGTSEQTSEAIRGVDGAYVVAGGAVTPGVGITVTVGAGGTAGTGGAAGGSGYVWIEYQVPA